MRHRPFNSKLPNTWTVLWVTVDWVGEDQIDSRESITPCLTKPFVFVASPSETDTNLWSYIFMYRTYSLVTKSWGESQMRGRIEVVEWKNHIVTRERWAESDELEWCVSVGEDPLTTPFWHCFLIGRQQRQTTCILIRLLPPAPMPTFALTVLVPSHLPLLKCCQCTIRRLSFLLIRGLEQLPNLNVPDRTWKRGRTARVCWAGS